MSMEVCEHCGAFPADRDCCLCEECGYWGSDCICPD
jgi:hypothetical protein